MSKISRRFHRKLLLSLAALVALVWVAVDQFGIAWREMGNLLLGTLLVVGAMIALAALCALVWVGLRKLAQRGDDN